jgi:hypothetical protein
MQGAKQEEKGKYQPRVHIQKEASFGVSIVSTLTQ